MSLVQDRPQMNYYSVRFQRTKPDFSVICFVVAVEGANRKGLSSLIPIFSDKFPGWSVCGQMISEAEFDRRSNEANEANLIDFDHRHPDELFDAIKNVNGNFFDPWRFT